MGLTVSSRSVKKIAVRRKKLTNFNRLIKEKKTLKIFPSLIVLLCVILG